MPTAEDPGAPADQHTAGAPGPLPPLRLTLFTNAVRHSTWPARTMPNLDLITRTLLEGRDPRTGHPIAAETVQAELDQRIRAREEIAVARARAARTREQSLRISLTDAWDAQEKVFLSILTPEQTATYREHHYVDVISNRSNRWRIFTRGQTGNVAMLDPDGRHLLASACAHPPGGHPDPAAWVAQALMLKTDEELFVDSANVSWWQPGTGPRIAPDGHHGW